jgi:tripartite-type tricarboxylate transporter receptor subunit TctC
MPQVPTTREAGVANTEVITWYGLLAPAGTPRAIVNRLNDIWAKAAATPELREKMQSSGSEIITTTPEQFSTMIRAEVPQWRKVITEANLKLE